MTDKTDNFGEYSKSKGLDRDLFIDTSGVISLNANQNTEIKSEMLRDLDISEGATNEQKINDLAINDLAKNAVVARGTGEGLILRLDGRINRNLLISYLIEYVESRKAFFSGQEVTLEWMEARPEDGVLTEISSTLSTRYQMIVKASRMFERLTKFSSHDGFSSQDASTLTGHDSSCGNDITNVYSRQNNQSSTEAQSKLAVESRSALRPVAVTSHFNPAGVEGQSLFDGLAGLGNTQRTTSSAPLSAISQTAINKTTINPFSSGQISSTQKISGFGSNFLQGKGDMQGFNPSESKNSASEALLWDEPDARIIRETLRGGQKIESEHSVVIVGDVNSGAEIVAGGDIFVLGRLRGVAHAGAYDESGAGRRIFALQMQPTQLRIGSIISQGSDENGRLPEMAKIEGNMIVVEPYGIASGTKKTGR